MSSSSNMNHWMAPPSGKWSCHHDLPQYPRGRRWRDV